MIAFEKGRFIASSLEESEFPSLKNDRGFFMPEIALAGRSNVGKSSLINILLRNKSLAKTSSTPGKTQRINFFLIDEQYVLVDLPGYGYSKAAKGTVDTWSRAIDHYLQNRTHLKLVLLLIDSRRGASSEDMAMIQWAEQKKIPLGIIFTKSDKLPRSQSAHAFKTLQASLPEHVESMAFSTQDPDARRRLIQLMNRIVQWDR